MGTGLLQPGHLLVILVIVMIVLGPGKLPEVGSALGKGLREFKRTTNDVGGELPGASVAALEPATTTLVGGATCDRCHTLAPVNARYCLACGRALPVVP